MRSTRRLCSLIALAAAWAALEPPAARSAQLEWIGGTDTSWHTPANWAPIVVPGEDPIQRVPQDGDTVLIADTTHGNLVQLNGDSARLAGLTVEGGFELTTAGYLLRVDDASSGLITVSGIGTTLAIESRINSSNDALVAFETDELHVGDGGTVDLRDSILQVDRLATIGSGGTLLGKGSARLGSNASPEGSILLIALPRRCTVWSPYAD